jgi:hypothetical protein
VFLSPGHGRLAALWIEAMLPSSFLDRVPDYVSRQPSVPYLLCFGKTTEECSTGKNLPTPLAQLQFEHFIEPETLPLARPLRASLEHLESSSPCHLAASTTPR